MRKILCGFVLSFMALSNSGLVLAEKIDASGVSKQVPEYLFVLEAKQANITKVDKGYEVYLSGVDKKMHHTTKTGQIKIRM